MYGHWFSNKNSVQQIMENKKFQLLMEKSSLVQEMIEKKLFVNKHVIRKKELQNFRLDSLAFWDIPESVWASDLASCTMLFSQLPVDPISRCGVNIKM